MKIKLQAKVSTVKLFVYGTLKRGYYNNHFLSEAIFIENDILENHKMYSKDYPIIVEGKGIVKGEVWKVSDKILENCDMLEIPYGYKRKIVNTVQGHKAWVYYSENKNVEWPFEEVKSGEFKMWKMWSKND